MGQTVEIDLVVDMKLFYGFLKVKIVISILMLFELNRSTLERNIIKALKKGSIVETH